MKKMRKYFFKVKMNLNNYAQDASDANVLGVLRNSGYS